MNPSQPDGQQPQPYQPQPTLPPAPEPAPLPQPQQNFSPQYPAYQAPLTAYEQPAEQPLDHPQRAYATPYDHGLPLGKKSRRGLFVGLGISAAVLLIGGGYIFGIYIPNKPENVYSTGLSRTGKVIDKLVAAGTEPSKLTAIESSDLSGEIEVAGPDQMYSGSFSTRYDENQSDTTLGYSSSTPGVASPELDDFSIQLMSDLAEGKTYPDIYFKISGLTALGVDSYIPGMSAYDGKWIGATAAYLESIIPAELMEESKKESDFSEKDAATLANIVTTTTREYVFTADEQKAVLVNKSFKGSEQLGDIHANRYEIGIHKAHAKDYCKALITNLTAADAFKRLPGVPTDDLAEQRDGGIL